MLLGIPFYSFAIDIWSLGCILAEIMLGKYNKERRLFKANSEIENILEVFRLFGTPSKGHFLRKLPFFNVEFPRFSSQVGFVFKNFHQRIIKLISG